MAGKATKKKGKRTARKAQADTANTEFWLSGVSDDGGCDRAF